MTEAGPAEIAALNEAIAGLYRSHRLSLLRLAAFLADDRAIADELVQDAFAALHQRWGSLTGKSAAPSYLRTTVVNSARSAQRRQGIVRRHLRVAEPGALPPAGFALLLAGEHTGKSSRHFAAYPAGSARYWYFGTGRTLTKPRSPRRSGYREAL